jgi:hypothetical protein
MKKGDKSATKSFGSAPMKPLESQRSPVKAETFDDADATGGKAAPMARSISVSAL